MDATGVQSLTIPITDMADPLIHRFPEMDSLRRGNIMARTRMIVLFDQSAAFGGLVIGTGNKTEALLGYTTLYAGFRLRAQPAGRPVQDPGAAAGKSPGRAGKHPAKPPSADLWQGQTDEGELGYTYAEVDELLFLLVEQRATPGECIQAGFSGNSSDRSSSAFSATASSACCRQWHPSAADR